MKEYICGIVVKERSADKALAQVQEFTPGSFINR